MYAHILTHTNTHTHTHTHKHTHPHTHPHPPTHPPTHTHTQHIHTHTHTTHIYTQLSCLVFPLPFLVTWPSLIWREQISRSLLLRCPGKWLSALVEYVTALAPEPPVAVATPHCSSLVFNGSHPLTLALVSLHVSWPPEAPPTLLILNCMVIINFVLCLVTLPPGALSSAGNRGVLSLVEHLCTARPPLLRNHLLQCGHCTNPDCWETGSICSLVHLCLALSASFPKDLPHTLHSTDPVSCCCLLICSCWHWYSAFSLLYNSYPTFSCSALPQTSCLLRPPVLSSPP